MVLYSLCLCDIFICDTALSNCLHLVQSSFNDLRKIKSRKISSSIKFKHVIPIIWHLERLQGKAADSSRIVSSASILNSFRTKLKTPINAKTWLKKSCVDMNCNTVLICMASPFFRVFSSVSLMSWHAHHNLLRFKNFESYNQLSMVLY